MSVPAGVIAESIIAPISGSASDCPISFGGSALSNSGTGIYGSHGEMHFALNGVACLSLDEDGIRIEEGFAILGPSGPYDGSGSYQVIAPDLELDADAGSDDDSDPKFLGVMMGNLLGADLTGEGNYLGGVIGAYSVTGTKSTLYPAGALLGIIMDGVTDADGAVVAVIDGDSGVTKAGAAFKARMLNSTAGSGVNYGLDLYDPGFGSYAALAILKADVRMSNQIVIMNGAGAPSNGTTGDDFAGTGSLYIDRTNGILYINTGAISNPTWVKVGTQS